jgi:hypothetical protein
VDAAYVPSLSASIFENWFWSLEQAFLETFPKDLVVELGRDAVFSREVEAAGFLRPVLCVMSWFQIGHENRRKPFRLTAPYGFADITSRSPSTSIKCLICEISMIPLRVTTPNRLINAITEPPFDRIILDGNHDRLASIATRAGT